jgi:putative phosphoserine phosphatase/1-acylglycerol-3-phosphate O-acyltransferase
MEKGGKGATFCDLDETLYPGLSIQDASRWFLAQGYLSKWNYLKIAWWILLKKIGHLDDEAAFAAGTQLFKGWTAAAFTKAVHKAYVEDLRPRLAPAVYAAVARWKQRGLVVLVTETYAPIAEAFARDLGVDAVIATTPEVKKNKLTGLLGGPVMRGEAKLAAIRDWAKEHRVDLRESTGVGGTIDDAPLIISCGRGIAVNPDDALARVARSAGWRIERI